MRGFDAREIGVDAVVAKDRGMPVLKTSVQTLLRQRVS